jgi:predicted transcriptional regulator
MNRSPEPDRNTTWDRLGSREREILEALFSRGEATVAQVLEALHDAPSYSAVRGMLAFLETKGYVKHRRDGLRYVYSPNISTSAAQGTALKKLVDTFFGGSPAQAVATLLDLPEHSREDLTIKELRKAVLSARRQGR